MHSAVRSELSNSRPNQAANESQTQAQNASVLPYFPPTPILRPVRNLSDTNASFVAGASRPVRNLSDTDASFVSGSSNTLPAVGSIGNTQAPNVASAYGTPQEYGFTMYSPANLNASRIPQQPVLDEPSPIPEEVQSPELPLVELTQQRALELLETRDWNRDANAMRIREEILQNIDLDRPTKTRPADKKIYGDWGIVIYLSGIYLMRNADILNINRTMNYDMRNKIDNLMTILNQRNISTGERVTKGPVKKSIEYFLQSNDREINKIRRVLFSYTPANVDSEAAARENLSDFAQLATDQNLNYSESDVRNDPGVSQAAKNLLSSIGAARGVAAGRGLKHTGLKTVKQIISRTENLIQAANLGNKSTEVRNELDTLLSVLIDRKEVRPQFRTNLMKKLF